MAHDHDHEHGSQLSETQLRVRALETVLTEKGYYTLIRPRSTVGRKNLSCSSAVNVV
jgi:hypothetical protein